MSSKKRIGLVLTVVILLLAAFAVNTAFGSGIEREPVDVHPPTCYRLEFFAPGVIGLECFDVGKDIVNVTVKTSAKYDLTWTNESVILYVYPVDKEVTTYWSVQDKMGSVVRGTLN